MWGSCQVCDERRKEVDRLRAQMADLEERMAEERKAWVDERRNITDKIIALVDKPALRETTLAARQHQVPQQDMEGRQVETHRLSQITPGKYFPGAAPRKRPPSEHVATIGRDPNITPPAARGARVEAPEASEDVS